MCHNKSKRVKVTACRLPVPAYVLIGICLLYVSMNNNIQGLPYQQKGIFYPSTPNSVES